MLVWHDSLAFRQQAYLTAQYPTYSGPPSVGLAHERGAARMIGAAGSITTPVLVSGQSTCVLGCLLKASGAAPSGTSTLLEILSLGTVQVRARVRPATDGFLLQFERGNGADILLRTPRIATMGTSVFLEVKAAFSQSEGKIIVRVDGQEVARAEGLDTEAGLVDTGWDQVRLSFTHSTSTFSIADLYLCDGRTDHGPLFTTFLGKVTHSEIRAGLAKTRQWAHSLNPAGKYRLVVFAGQSNFTGRNTAPSSSAWRSPNTKIQIWDRITGSAAWKDLRATVNTSGMFGGVSPNLSGPEMRFAERLALLYESTGDSAAPRTRIIKGTQDASFLFPTTGDYCWNHAVDNNLWDGPPVPPTRGCLRDDIAAAVASLGGWSAVERVDFFWYQGENDSIYSVATAAYRAGLIALFEQVKLLVSVPMRIHLVRLHAQLYTGVAPDSFGFFYRDAIRATQWDAPNFLPDCVTISSDNCEISTADWTHLTPSGYDTLGDLCFESWLQAQDFHGYVGDYSDLAWIDERWVGTASSGKEISFTPVGLADSTNAPVLSIGGSLHANRDFASSGLVASAAGRSLPSVAPALGAWAAFRRFAAGLDLPEVLTSDIEMTTL